MPWPTPHPVARRRLARPPVSPKKAVEVVLPPEAAPVAASVLARTAEEVSPLAPPSLDDLVDELDEIPIEAAKRLVLPSQRGLRPHCSLAVDDDTSGFDDFARRCAAGLGSLKETTDEPLRMPKLPLAARLAARLPERGSHFETGAPRGFLSAREPSSSHSRRGGVGGSSWSSSSMWLSPRGAPLRSEDLQRTIQNVDFGRLEARLRESDDWAPRPPPPSARREEPSEATPKQGLRLGRTNSINSCDTEDGSVPLVGLVELEAMESVFSTDGDSSLQETVCDDEVQLLYDSSAGVCGGGCRFTKLTGGLRRFGGPDENAVGGLHAFLSRADDDVLSYILHPARGWAPAEPPVGMLTKL